MGSIPTPGTTNRATRQSADRWMGKTAFLRQGNGMKILALALSLLALAGCAAFDSSLERDTGALHAPDIEAAIKAARPGEPR